MLHFELLELLESLNKVDQSDCPRVHLQRDFSLFFKQGYLYHCAHESTHIKTQNDLKCCEEQAKKASYITLTTKKCWPIKSLQTMTSKKVSDHLHVG